MHKLLLSFSILFIVSCQSTPPKKSAIKIVKKPEVTKQKEIKQPIRKISHKPVIKKSVELKEKSYPPNTLSPCPAGVSGLVGSIERGRHCFVYEPKESKKCFDKNSEDVVSEAQKYCEKLQIHMVRLGRWNPAPNQHLVSGLRKSSSCSCGLYQGKSICKSYFNFRCEWEIR